MSKRKQINLIKNYHLDKTSNTSNPIVPSSSVTGTALTCVVAIMAFLASLSIGGVTLVSKATHAWQTNVSREITIQIMPDSVPDMSRALMKVVNIAVSSPAVASAEIIDEQETSKLLEPWLGQSVNLADLPLPRLVRIHLAEISQKDIEALRNRLYEEIPSATLDDHRIWIDRLDSMADTMVAMGLGVLTLIIIATVLSVVFATRAAMESNRDIIEVLHYVGANNGFIAGQYQKHFLLLGLKGGMFGGFSAAILFYAVAFFFSVTPGTPEADQIAALTGSVSLGSAGYLSALILVAMIAILTAATSRITVYRYLVDHSYLNSDDPKDVSG